MRSRNALSGQADSVVVYATESAASRGRGRILDRAAQMLFVVPAGVYIALYFGFPAVQSVIMSFQAYTTTTFYTGEAPWVGLANYVQVVSSSIFATSVTNTVIFTVGSLAGQFAIGLGLALFFKQKFPLNNVLRSLLLLPWLIPLLASSTAWRWILDQDNGILNQVLGSLGLPHPIPWLSSPDVALVSVIAVNIWLGIPFNTALLYGGLQGIPEELYEAAAVDGATGWKAFRYITWPSLRPVVGVVLVLGVVYTLKAIEIILALTNGGPANATQTLASAAYHESFQLFSFGTGSALSNILVVVSLVFAMVYLRLNRSSTDD